jgi:hypothetical protein
MSAQPNVCPVCGKNDAIQKVSGVVASGQASGTFSGPSGGVVNVDGKWGAKGGYTTLSGSTVSNLAALLSPPPAPRKWPFGFFGTVLTVLIWYFVVLPLVGGSIVFLIAAVVNLINNGLGWPTALAGVLVCLLSLGVGILIIRWYVKKFREARANHPLTRAAWESAIQRWERSYYCNRDDVVFDPDTGRTCQPQGLKLFLYA